MIQTHILYQTFGVSCLPLLLWFGLCSVPTVFISLFNPNFSVLITFDFALPTLQGLMDERRSHHAVHYSPWTWFSSTEEKVHRPLPLLALEDGDPTDPDEHVEGGPGQDFPNAWQLPEGSYDGDESNNFGFSHLEFY